MNVRAGTARAFSEPGPWLPGICPDESLNRPEDVLEPSSSQFPSVCVSVCMPQRDGRLSTFSSSKLNVEGCTVRGQLKEWGSASV